MPEEKIDLREEQQRDLVEDGVQCFLAVMLASDTALSGIKSTIPSGATIINSICAGLVAGILESNTSTASDEERFSGEKVSSVINVLCSASSRDGVSGAASRIWQDIKGTFTKRREFIAGLDQRLLTDGVKQSILHPDDTAPGAIMRRIARSSVAGSKSGTARDIMRHVSNAEAAFYTNRLFATKNFASLGVAIGYKIGSSFEYIASCAPKDVDNVLVNAMRQAGLFTSKAIKHAGKGSLLLFYTSYQLRGYLSVILMTLLPMIFSVSVPPVLVVSLITYTVYTYASIAVLGYIDGLNKQRESYTSLSSKDKAVSGSQGQAVGMMGTFPNKEVSDLVQRVCSRDLAASIREDFMQSYNDQMSRLQSIDEAIRDLGKLEKVIDHRAPRPVKIDELLLRETMIKVFGPGNSVVKAVDKLSAILGASSVTIARQFYGLGENVGKRASLHLKSRQSESQPALDVS